MYICIEQLAKFQFNSNLSINVNEFIVKNSLLELSLLEFESETTAIKHNQR